MTYTPGPWTIDHQRIGPPGEPVALLCDVNDPMTGTVIDWPRGNDSGTAMSIDDAENEANARLIAAAPALLAALTRAYHALSNIINASDNCECGARGSGDYCKCPLGSGPYKPVELQDDSRPDSFMADCNLAYAAIAKATTAGWMPEDIETLRPDWTEDRCLKFLKENEKYIVEAMVRDGWGAIEALLPTEKEEL